MRNTISEHMRKPEPNNAGGFLAGMVLGGLAGAGTMLLLAPQAGKQTRDEIQSKGIALRDQTVEAVENAMADARVQTRRITDPMSKQAKDLQQRSQVIVDEQSDRLSAGIERLSA